MPEHLPDETALIELAGSAAFERGRSYHRAGRVTLLERTPSALVGETRGTETYHLLLKIKGSDWQWDCSCPAAENGAFCKHLVAAVLTAHDDSRIAGATAAPSPQPSAPDHMNDLLEFLRAQPGQRLAEWLHAIAMEDGDVAKRLLLYRAAEQPGTLKPALAKLLNTGGFLDYRRAMAYARRLSAAVKQLSAVLDRDPDECRVLCEYVLGRLFKIYGSSDDSAGAIGEVLASIADLYAQACAAAPPGVALVKPFLSLKTKDNWGLLSLARYWQALGPQGQAAYGKRVVADFERLPAISKPGEYLPEGFESCRRTEELARCSGDFDLLQRVLRRDLTHSHQHLLVLESLREFGRAREALAWAEAAVKRFPDDGRLRILLAECLSEGGLGEEALEQVWQAFLRHPDEKGWDALKRMAGAEWPVWRQRALDTMATREGAHASLRIRLLLHDGDLTTAVTLARSHGVGANELLLLAQRLRGADPTAAGTFYLRLARELADDLRHAGEYARLVGYLKNASALLPIADCTPLLAEIRAQHARKTKLIGMLDKASL